MGLNKACIQGWIYVWAKQAEAEMEPVRIFLTRPVKFKIYTGWPVTDRPVRPVFCFAEGLHSVFGKPNGKLFFTLALSLDVLNM